MAAGWPPHAAAMALVGWLSVLSAATGVATYGSTAHWETKKGSSRAVPWEATAWGIQDRAGGRATTGYSQAVRAARWAGLDAW